MSFCFRATRAFRSVLLAVGLGIGIGGVLGGCSKSGGAEAASEVASAPAVLTRVPAAPAPRKFVPGDAARGEKLVQEHQCNRCHEGTGQPPASRESGCVNCHREILAGTFPATKDKLERWKPNVKAVRAVPSLHGIDARFDPAWLTSFLLAPVDLRPMLAPSMPRLALTESDARDIVTFLTTKVEPPSGAASVTPASAEELALGRRLIEQRGCGSCHHFSGVPGLPQTPSAELAEVQDAVVLAPDLRYTRERWSRAKLVSWLRDPRAMKADTLMPPTGLDAEQARAVAEYLLGTPLAPLKRAAPLARPPLLERRVTFAEVDGQVFRRTCRHCHGDPEVARGDGGPGNTGGFGFKPRGIDFSSYRAIQSGYLDANGERRSLFEATAGGVPRLVAALLARHEEQAGGPAQRVRGMPLGLPALTMEQIQLVDTWIAQGRPR